MQTKNNKHSYYSWKASSGLICVIILIFLLMTFFFGYPSFLSGDLNSTLLVKWDSSRATKVAYPKSYFWLVKSEKQQKEALEKGVPASKLVLDLRQGIKIDTFVAKQALFNDANLARAIVGSGIQQAWFERRRDRQWHGFNWAAEVVEARQIAWWHSFDPTTIILLDSSRLTEFSASVDSLPKLKRKFLPAYKLLVPLALIICGFLIHPFMIIMAIFIGSGYWHLDISLQQELVLWGTALSLVFSHWTSIWQRYKVGTSQAAHGVLHAILLWPFRGLLASALVYLAAWREDIGDFLIGHNSYTVSDPIDAFTCLILAYILVCLASFIPWFWAKIMASGICIIPVVLFLSYFQLGQINFPNLFAGGFMLLLISQLIFLFILCTLMRFRKRSGHLHLGYFGFGNLGDDLLLICQLRRQSEIRDHTVIVADSAKLPSDLKQIEVIFRKDLAAILDYCSKRKSIFLGPGGVLQDKSSRKSLYYYIAFGIMARIMGCSWYWSGQGFSPLKHYGSIRLVLLASWLVNLIEVRDKSSYDYLVKLGVNPSKIEITRDLVWDLELPVKYPSTNSLAIVLRTWESAPLETWIKQISGIGIKRQYFLFEKDVYLEKLIRTRDSKAGIFVYKGDWRDFLRRFYACSHILSMRFHGLILGLKLNRKCFSLAYDEKCELSEINPKFVLNSSNWATLLPQVKDFMETISQKRS